ncbi:MAG: Re/Si-specific NAD(P)(+) transhydrogenase subunit alpha [Gemmatimonadetes bacterium]|nr:Re/Si-specific NAD(P)(+) transhydrogenase subunit alpha [Gemmatimonadota bacterium]MYG16643.1 Re/Si-specific NAD(P)(+) transhydrogenase subunit alpha [Gemmatimonadota bacterium]
MTIGVPTETSPGERRVSIVPAGVGALVRAGCAVRVSAGAGREAGIADADYEEAGALVVPDRGSVFSEADAIVQVRGGGANPDSGMADVELLREGQVLIGFLEPLSASAEIQALADRRATACAMELIPRTSRAQSMDALSSQANIGGYRAALMAAEYLPKLFPMMMTAAGTITPAHVFVVGVGVAGLQAISTCKRLGAVIQAYDVRPAVKEQVQSVGARFVELELDTAESEGSGGYAQAMDEQFYAKQREMMARVVSENDVVITTAAVPGKPAPVLVTEDMVKSMNPGSVVIDLAAERGGNCEITEPGKTVVKHGVTLVGELNLPSTVPFHASQMYSNNIVNFLKLMINDGALDATVDDDIVQGATVTRDGEIVNELVRSVLDGTG